MGGTQGKAALAAPIVALITVVLMQLKASGCPPSARAYAAAVGLKDSFVLIGGCEGHLPWQVVQYSS
jgi:hypothetical protein